MNYPTKCTHALPLLLNLKSYKDAHIYQNDKEMYIDVQSLEESIMISTINFYQKATFKRYQQLIELTENKQPI